MWIIDIIFFNGVTKKRAMSDKQNLDISLYTPEPLQLLLLPHAIGASVTSSRESRIFDLSIFSFAQELYCAETKNDDLDSTRVQPTSLRSLVQNILRYTQKEKEQTRMVRPTLSLPLSNDGLEDR